MKKMCVILVVLVGLLPGWARGQSTEAAQLLLNVEKLNQLKNILTDLKKSYTILSNGYTSIRNIAEGNFSLHKVFLDGLMQVSPAVKKYRKVAGIVEYQIAVVKECKAASDRFNGLKTFRAAELEYLSAVYGNLIKLSLGNLDELILVVTAGQLRMSDDERLAAIDRIYAEMEDKLLFLRDFNGRTALMGLQRAKEKEELKGLGNMREDD
ncbi:TerB family tellurite resistance protein [Chitinophaga horti]|uniref:TerB family tellurite resistance protein n=1 Tax=Chitinophaga horti TaxID=2920382 RepID=A0ABY6J8I6_9BACT|nr:TerB family tellurite resistance protein [Chitinophaga horti]UYQ95991.1 TerB family tellurite resistance protein [Chitinophaga horti]